MGQRIWAKPFIRFSLRYSLLQIKCQSHRVFCFRIPSIQTHWLCTRCQPHHLLNLFNNTNLHYFLSPIPRSNEIFQKKRYDRCIKCLNQTQHDNINHNKTYQILYHSICIYVVYVSLPVSKIPYLTRITTKEYINHTFENQPC